MEAMKNTSFPLHLLYQSDSEYRANSIPHVHLQHEQILADDYKCDCLGKNEREFYSEKEIVYDPATYSLPICITAPRDFLCESSAFLPSCNKCRYLCSQKGAQANAEGNQMLKEMIMNMYEPAYEELSFKEFLREQQSMEDSRQEEVKKKDGRNCKNKVKLEQDKRSSKQNSLPRSERIDSERFLLKVSLPVSLGSKMPKVSSTKSPSRMSSSDISMTRTGSHLKMNNTNSKTSSKWAKSGGPRAVEHPNHQDNGGVSSFRPKQHGPYGECSPCTSKGSYNRTTTVHRNNDLHTVAYCEAKKTSNRDT